ncbi:MAG: hypothetical protein QXN56_02860 [Candidatus Hadarchaeum sp.]
MIVTALVFHAEKLHDDHVWKRVIKIARWTTRQGMRLTFFVYPFRAQVEGKEIAERVRSLAALGHEIGQHTHFYAGSKVDKPDKATDLSQANIRHCLFRDFEVLRSLGVQPRGFVAGAWIVNEVVWDTLIELGFGYDCSARFPKGAGVRVSPYHRWLGMPQFYIREMGRLLCLPTTCSLGEWFKWGRTVTTVGYLPYQLVYLHDYDLLSTPNCLLPWLFLIMNRHNRFFGTGALADFFTP